MLYDIGVLLVSLILLLPIVVFGLVWARVPFFYRSTHVSGRQKLFYLVALTTGSACTLPYAAYWSWRVCQMYNTKLPFVALLALDRSIYASRLLCLIAIACLLIGRGPYRLPALLAMLWVLIQLWMHGGVIHWA